MAKSYTGKSVNGVPFDENGDVTVTVSNTITNPADNRVLTSLGTTNTANAEENLTFDGSMLDITGKVVADKLGVDITASSTLSIGEMRWNNTDGTIEFMMKGGNVVQQIGQELPVLVKHADNSGLINGRAVYTVGSDGANLTVRYASALTEATSSTVFGVMTENATGGAKAFCTTFGLVRDINTSTLTEGAPIWIDASGNGTLTSTKPIPPLNSVYVGVCLRTHATVGAIFINIQNGYELGELQGVSITTPTNNDALIYDAATGLWENKPIPTALAYTTVEIDLGTAKRSGSFVITSTGLTVGKQVIISQATSPYTGKGTMNDESEMDFIAINGVVTSATTIKCFWNSQTFVKGNFKFNYLVVS